MKTDMKITIKFPSLFKVYSGVDQDKIDITEGATVDQLSKMLSVKYKELPFDGSQTFFVVNDKISTKTEVLKDGDEVRIYQALAGG